jgi:hypothetical protein
MKEVFQKILLSFINKYEQDESYILNNNNFLYCL